MNTQMWTYNIIAIQKSWENSFTNTIYCFSHSPFTLTYNNCKRRSCFLINKEISSNNWDVKFSSPDLCVLNLHIEGLNIQIYNVYSQSSGSLFNTDYTLLISLLSVLIQQDEKHILLRNFNLHHSWWSGSSNLTIYTAAESLIKCLTMYNMFLTS